MIDLKVHGSVILTGAVENLTKAHKILSESFTCHHYRDNALLVADVAEHELPFVERVATETDSRVEQVRDSHTVRLAEDEGVKQPKQPNLELLAGGWYKTNQEAFPLIHVISTRNEIQSDGVQSWLFEVDLVAADALPQPTTMSADQLKQYKLKPASLDDFEDLDIAPPDGFEPNPHVIPSVEDDVEEFQKKITGSSLPQAQMAAMQLRKQLGLRTAVTEVVPLPGRGFYVQARLLRHVADAPSEVAGVQVHYRDAL